ncbi:MAG TPA: FAD-dependent oxidoreductase [Patescibacteria group bacterium]|nr:FAD-dependent oxidoreductase [Patescibacteria group bacterium]
MQVTLEKTEEVALNTRTFWFRPERPLDYVAGQYIEMSLPHQGADDRGTKRWFTLSSSPSEPLLSMTTKKAVDRMSTFKQTLFGLSIGTQVTMSEAMGDFVLPKDTTIPLVFVAGGIGITPMRSMVKWLTDQGERRQIHVIYGARQLEDVAFQDLFQNYGAQFDIVLSDQVAGWSGRTGRLSAELILDIAGKTSEQLYYVSGPEPLTEALEADLGKAGIAHNKLVLDFFPGYPLP